MSTWLNDDGLFIKFGTAEGETGQAGAVANPGVLHTLELTIDLANDLTASSAIVDNHNYLPNGAQIEEIEIVVDTAATSGGTATLDIDAYGTDRVVATSDGFLNAVALATIDTVGEKQVLRQGDAGAGSLVGAKLTEATLLGFNYNTAPYTAGVIVVRIKYRPL